MASTISSLIVKVSADSKAFVSGMQQSAVAAKVMKTALVSTGASLALYAVGLKTNTGLVIEAGKAFTGVAAAIRSGTGAFGAAIRGILGIGKAWATSLPGVLTIGVAIGGIATAAAVSAAALAAMAVPAIANAVKLSAAYEQVEISIKTMTGSAEKAAKLLSEVNQFESATPFEFDELANAAKSLVAFGTAPEAVVPTLRTLGNIAAAVSIPIGELSELYGKVMVQGRVFAEDINQFTGRGLPVQKALQQQFGVTGEKLREMVRNGEVSAAHLQRALVQIGDVQFAGLVGEQAKTLNGLFSTLRSSVTAIKRDIGAAFSSAGLKTFTQDLIMAADAVREVAKGMKEAAEYASKLQPEKGSASAIAGNIGGLSSAGDAPVLGTLNRLWSGAALFGDIYSRLKPPKEGAEKTLADYLDEIAVSAAKAEKSKQSLTALHNAATKLFEETRTPAEKFMEQTKEVFSVMAFGGVSIDTAGRAINKYREEMNNTLGEMEKTRGEAQREGNKKFLEFWEKGAAVIEQARTPLEKYKATFEDLVKLFAVGAIDIKTLGKANAAAHADFAKSETKGKSFKSPLQNREFVRDFFFDNIGGIAPDKKKGAAGQQYAAAIEAGTQAAYSATLGNNNRGGKTKTEQLGETAVAQLKGAGKTLDKISRQLKITEVAIA